MTAAEIALVQTSFRKVLPIADHVTALFYVRLFELDPSLRRQTCGEREEQGRRLARTIDGLVRRLPRFGELQPALRRLGARQARHGARDEHYAYAGTALVWSLEKALGPEFTPPVKSAWTRFFVELASTMLDGAHLHQVAA